MAGVTYKLPLPPTTNNLFNSGTARRYVSPVYAAWQRMAGWELQAQRAAAPHPMIQDPVQLIVLVRRPSGRSDLDNRLKAPLDLLVKHGVIRDDSQIERLVAAWADVEGCVVTVEPLP